MESYIYVFVFVSVLMFDVNVNSHFFPCKVNNSTYYIKHLVSNSSLLKRLLGITTSYCIKLGKENMLHYYRECVRTCAIPHCGPSFSRKIGSVKS